MDKKIKSRPFICRLSIDLPASKSMSNRVLILKHLSQKDINIVNLSEANDTVILYRILNGEIGKWDAGIAGTVMRFLTAYAITLNQEVEIVGSKSLYDRPITDLVNALKKLGAQIEYLKEEGFPPIKISPSKIKGGKIKMPGSMSSQFISSIMMIGPYIKNGIEIEILSKLYSKPFIQLTIELLNYFGIEAEWKENTVVIKEGELEEKDITIESDWTSASYWYQVVTLLDLAEITLTGLRAVSWQGDKEVMKIFQHFGVNTQYQEKAVLIRRDPLDPFPNEFNYDFTNCPDLSLTVACTMVAIGCHGKLTGLHTLKVKETDRIKALQNEFKKLGVDTKITETSIEILPFNGLNDNVTIETYNDHRMALAFAPLGLVCDNLRIKNAEVVRKSYPNYWHDLEKAGIVFEDC